MHLSQSLPRLSLKDLEDLMRASDLLAQVAESIKATKASWVPIGVQSLIQANDVLMRIHGKGIRAIETWRRTHEGAGNQLEAGGPRDAEPSAGDRSLPLPWPGSDGPG